MFLCSNMIWMSMKANNHSFAVHFILEHFRVVTYLVSDCRAHVKWRSAELRLFTAFYPPLILNRT